MHTACFIRTVDAQIERVMQFFKRSAVAASTPLHTFTNLVAPIMRIICAYTRRRRTVNARMFRAF